MVKVAMEMKEKLTNGITISYYDESKKIAGDRWVVKLRCQASVPLQQWMLDELKGDDEQTTFCRNYFDGQLLYETTKERNFVDEEQKTKTLEQLQKSFNDNALRYLAKEVFIRQLFVTEKIKCTEQYILQLNTSLLPKVNDDDAPDLVDFSACFQ